MVRHPLVSPRRAPMEGSPVTSYTVTSSPAGITATDAASPVLVTGLTNGTAYTFTVAATNTAGTGISSAPSSAVTPVEPVTGITGYPETGTTGTEIDLTTATVNPVDATNKTIVWSVKNAGTTGITTANLATGKFTPATAGALELTATITNGASSSTNYYQGYHDHNREGLQSGGWHHRLSRNRNHEHGDRPDNCDGESSRRDQ